MTNRKIARFCQQLSSLFLSGIPLVTALEVIGQTAFFKRENPAIGRAVARVQEGAPLNKALEEFLPPLACSTIRGAEKSGTVEKALTFLGRYYEQKAELAEKLSGALVYPAFIAGVSLCLLVFLVVYVVPSMGGLLGDLQSGLPPLTVAVMAVSRFIINDWGYLLAAVFLFGFIIFYKREKVLANMTRLPLIGELYRRELAIFSCLILGTLLEGGVPLAEALDINVKAAADQTFRADLSRLKAEVENGKKLSEAVAGSRYFPAEAVALVAIGENSGQLGKAFLDIAAFKSREREAGLDRLAKLLEPAITATVGVLVAFIVLALFLPLLQMVAALS